MQDARRRIAKWARYCRRNPGLVAGLALMLPFLLFALLPGVFATHNPIKTSIRELYTPPNAEHFFGTDELGRDVYSRVVHGARISLASASIIIGTACLIGVVLGTVAGFWGGWSDRVIMTLVDLVLAFPSLILALAVSAALGPGLRSAIIAAAAVWWPVYARLLRGITIQLSEMEFVTAARAMGASAPSIILRHILPNAVYAIIVRISLDLGLAVLLLASLSFIGLGASAPTPEWGCDGCLGTDLFFDRLVDRRLSRIGNYPGGRCDYHAGRWLKRCAQYQLNDDSKPLVSGKARN